MIEDPKSAEILKPILRGRDIKRYRADWKGCWLIDSHNGYRDVPPVDINGYPAIKNYLGRQWDQISLRQDQGNTPYNLRNCAYQAEFKTEKLVWPETMRVHKTGNPHFPRFGLKPAGMCLDKTCFMMDMPDKFLFLGVINSKLGWKIIDTYVDKLDTGGYMMQKVMVAEMPLPKPESLSQNVVDRIGSLIQQIIDYIGRDQDINSLELLVDKAVYQMYDLTKEEIEMIEAQVS